MTDPPGLVSLLGRGRATVPELLQARATATPDAVFLRRRDRTWTYAEALAEARRFAGWALTTPAAGGGRIASFLDNRPEAIWAWLGTLVGGAVYAPLNRSHRGDLLREMLARSGSTVLVTDAEGLTLLPAIAGTAVALVLVVDGPSAGRTACGVPCVGWDAVAAAEPGEAPPAKPGDVAELMYTSGATGRSKAVLLTHNQMCRGASWLAHVLAMTPDDVIHAWLPLYHIGGQLDTVLISVVAGSEVALYPRFSRSRFWRQVEESRATLFIGFSNVIELLWALPERREDRECTLRAGIVGGIPPALHRRFEERFGLRLCEAYGMTEAEPLALADPDFPVGSVGRPRPDLEIAILDDGDETLRAGEVGEICVRPRRPDLMFVGYEGDEAATLAATRSLWFHTGDLGRFDADGFLYFVDRKKHRIRRRGENVSSWELEQIVAQHPDVDECAAVGVPAPLGEEDVKLVVALLPRSDVSPDRLRLWCERRMASFMVPRYVEVLDRLPRMSTGKVRKEDLRAIGPDTWDAERAGARS